MSVLTAIVEEYQDILPPEVYMSLHKAAAEVHADQISSLEAPLRAQLHSACETYTKDLKTIVSDTKNAKSDFLKVEEEKDNQNAQLEMKELGL